MKRMIPIVLSALAVSTSVLAQAPADPVATALAAAPANLREGATVVKWKPDFTYDTLKKGTNRLVCYDRSGFPEQQPFSIECTSTSETTPVATAVATSRVTAWVRDQASTPGSSWNCRPGVVKEK